MVDLTKLCLPLCDELRWAGPQNLRPVLRQHLAYELMHFRMMAFAAPEVRACALRDIGRMRVAGAVEFLTNLKPSDLGVDGSQLIWPAAQIALREAQLDGLKDSVGETRFLEQTVTERHDPASNVAITLWAIDQLCDRGAETSLPIIRSAIMRMWPDRRGEEDIEFCQARMQIVNSGTDRVKALASVLTSLGAEIASVDGCLGGQSGN